MRFDPAELDDDVLAFLAERHLSTLSLTTSRRPLHVTPVGFTWDGVSGTARVITFAGAKKVRLIEHAASSGEPIDAALSQVDGGRWLTLYGVATVSSDPVVNADAERRYAERYRPPGDRGADRRTIEIDVAEIVGRC